MPEPSEYTGSSGFAHLHCHSIYSALDGVATIEEYAEKCVDNGWPGMAITEHGHMGSVPDFHFEFKKHGLKSIFGCEIYFNDYEPQRQSLVEQGIKLKSQAWRAENFALATRINRNRHLTVLCKNEVGLHNLLKLTTEAYDDGLFGAGSRKMNRIWFDKLCKHREGLIILSGCLNGPVAHELRYKELRDKEDNLIVETTRKERFQAAATWVKKFKDAFGEDYYIELQMPGIEDDYEVFWDLVGLADYFGLKTVLANDCWNPEVTVQTINGSKRLCDIRPGEYVWTHKNRLREVQCIGKRKVRDREELYGFLGSQVMVCTENHRLYSKCHETGLIGMKEIRDISPDDFIHVAAPILPDDDLKELTISDYIDDPRCKVRDGLIYPFGGKSINPIPNVIELTDELLWLFGIYIAEGHTDKDYRLGFAGNDLELDRFSRIQEYFTQFGFSPSDISKVSDKGRSIRICSSGFSKLFANCCGFSVYAKKLPQFWTKLSSRQLSVLIRGYVEGDGCISRRSFFTTSFQLFTDLMHAFACLGVGVTPQLRPAKDAIIKKKDGRRISTRHREGYTGSIGKAGIFAIGLGEYFDASKVRSKHHQDHHGVWIKNPFKVVKSDLKEVWCIQVEDDHSFLVGLSSGNSHYIQRKDFEIQKIMMATAQGTTVDSPDLFHVNSSEQYFKTRAELWSYYASNRYCEKVSSSAFEAMCDATLEIVDKCDYIELDSNPKFPRITDDATKLTEIVMKALRMKGLDKVDRKFVIDGREVTYVQQATIELTRFISKGFASYFLITQDLIMYGKSQGWIFGPRGCSIPTEKVVMGDGSSKAILDIEVGDDVLDGFDNPQTVENKFIYDVSEELITIDYGYDSVTVTSDHKLYVIRDEIVVLLKASEIKDTDEIIDTRSDLIDNHDEIHKS